MQWEGACAQKYAFGECVASAAYLRLMFACAALIPADIFLTYSCRCKSWDSSGEI